MESYDLINQYKQVHQENKEYGTSAFAYIQEICLFIRQLKPKVVLDYGCGKGHLVDALKYIFKNISFYKYDPAIDEFSALPVKKADLVINTDVLEHVPYDKIDMVLKEISEISSNVIFALAHYPAATILPNGENAHCILAPPLWYKNKLSEFFPNVKILKWRQNDCRLAVTFNLKKQTVKNYAQIVGIKLNFPTYIKEVMIPCLKSNIYLKKSKKDKYIEKYKTDYYDLV